jgi:hypothetical protein
MGCKQNFAMFVLLCILVWFVCGGGITVFSIPETAATHRAIEANNPGIATVFENFADDYKWLWIVSGLGIFGWFIGGRIECELIGNRLKRNEISTAQAVDSVNKLASNVYAGGFGATGATIYGWVILINFCLGFIYAMFWMTDIRFTFQSELFWFEIAATFVCTMFVPIFKKGLWWLKWLLVLSFIVHVVTYLMIWTY